MNNTYKYIKGTTIVSDERMLSAYEIADKYDLLTPNDFKPNEELIESIIDSYMIQHNYKESEYYYVEKNMRIYRVYPNKTVKNIIKFITNIFKEANITKSNSEVYNLNGIDFMYCSKRIKHKNTVVNIFEYKKEN